MRFCVASWHCNPIVLSAKRIFVLLVLACLVVATPAQQKRNATAQRKPATTKQAAKSSSASKDTQKKPSAPQKKQPAKPATTVKSLQTERKKVQQQIKEQEQRLRANEQNVKKRLQNLMVINNEITDKRNAIEAIRHDIDSLDADILVLKKQLKTLEKELEERKQRYQKSLRYLHRNRSIQSQLMFIFSADNFSQMYRRFRFVREYAHYQQTQGEAVKSMRAQVKAAYDELTAVMKQKQTLLAKGEEEKKSLEAKQAEQKTMVASLQKQQKTINSILEKQRKRDAELNGQIDKLIAEEIARAKARAEAEEKRKAEEAAKKAAREKANAERSASKTGTGKQTADRKKTTDTQSRKKEVAETKGNAAPSTSSASSEDRRLSGNFESNRGRLPMPLSGKIVSRFGTQAVTDVKGHVVLDKKGIDIKGQPGAPVYCVFDGEVRAVFAYSGTTVVIISHGSYMSVYCELASVSVRRGQKVSTRQKIGTVGSEGVLQFQLRKGTSKLNPESWLSR